MTSALSGSTTEPVIAKRIRSVVTASSASASGRRPPRLESWSTKRADSPATATGPGAGPSRTAATRSSAGSFSAGVAGVSWMSHVRSPT